MISGLDYLKLAESMVNGAGEAEWRSAVSRAYYGAFHAARTLMRDLGFVVPRADRAHAYLCLRLANCGVALIGDAGNRLNSLRGDRNFADYDIDRTLSQANARIQVQVTRQIIQALAGATAEPTRTQITDAMRIYERAVLRDVTWAP